MRSSTAAILLAFVLGATALPKYEWQELSARTGGTCTGPASSLTGEECAKAPQAQGFMYNGECLSLKMAGGSVHKHQSGQCHKNIGGGAAASGSGTRSRPRDVDWQELSARTGGTCTGPASSLTGEECAKAPQAQGFMYNGECLSLKMAGGSVHKHQSGQCHKNIGGGAAASGSGTRSRPRSYDIDDIMMDIAARALDSLEWQELSARTGGTCTGPASSLTGEECAKAPQAQGFMYNGECLSLKMAGGSVHKHQSGQCHKNIGGGAAASGSGTRSRPRDVDALEFQELSARSGGTCTGPASSLTGEECAKAPQAQGFMYNGECLSLKMAGGSVHKHQSGQCHKNIGGGAVASGSGTTRSRPRAVDAYEWQELSARTGGTCTGPASSLTGEECAKAPQAQGFMYNGECLSLKMAGGSVHKHQTGQCHKNIGGGASGSGTHSRPRSYDVEDIINDIVARAAELQDELEARRQAW